MSLCSLLSQLSISLTRWGFVKRGMIFWFLIQVLTLLSCVGALLCWLCKFQGESGQCRLINVIRECGCACLFRRHLEGIKGLEILWDCCTSPTWHRPPNKGKSVLVMRYSPSQPPTLLNLLTTDLIDYINSFLPHDNSEHFPCLKEAYRQLQEG